MATANTNTAPGATRPVDQHVEFVVKVSFVLICAFLGPMPLLYAVRKRGSALVEAVPSLAVKASPYTCRRSWSWLCTPLRIHRTRQLGRMLPQMSHTPSSAPDAIPMCELTSPVRSRAARIGCASRCTAQHIRCVPPSTHATACGRLDLGGLRAVGHPRPSGHGV